MRLIDADSDALIARINNNFGPVTRFIIKSILKDATTIEAEPVRHGRWEWNKDHWECTNCRGNRRHDLVLGLDAAYCGRCGAKMDGGVDE